MTNSKNSTDFLSDNLPLPCKSRCSAKSHSSSCLSSQYENQYFEEGDCSKGPLWFTIPGDEEFPRLLTTPPSSSREPDPLDIDKCKKKKRRKKRKKKTFTVDVGVVQGGSSRRTSHRCKKGGVCRRQRLHSEDSSNRRTQEHSKRARLAVLIVALSLIMLSFLLVGLTLRMAPIIDELVRKGNEEIYRSMSAGASTSSPTTEAANTTTPSSGTPG